jgi:3-hydroxymyristoyl/3-hydroxydecanoyl-(acyl carrier protein) dehydratase
VFVFRRELAVFAGHFPGKPIVPGVMLIETVRETAAMAARRSLRTVEVSRAKFAAPAPPDEEIEILLKLSDKDGALTARGVVNVAGAMRATVTLILEEAEL